LFETLLILRRIQRDIIKMFKPLRLKYPLLLSDFNENRIFWTYFGGKSQISSFIKIHPVTAELFLADRQTDMHDEANTPFSQFYERA
jgi:hypothetical protein